MDKDLMIKQDDQLALNHAELLKPLISDIHLFDTYIANTAVNNNREAIDRLTVGTELSLRREVNKFEESAIAVMDAGGDKIGYIPEKDTVIFARLMDAGKLLIARVSNIEKRGRGRYNPEEEKREYSYCIISIGIYLKDY